MRSHLIPLLCALLLTTAGCISLSVGTKDNPDRLQMEGLANAYVSVNGIHSYDGNILYLGLFSKANRDGEIVSFELWPLTGIGVGLVGVRLQLLPLEIGVGTLFYNPRAPKDKETPCGNTPSETSDNQQEKQKQPEPE